MADMFATFVINALWTAFFIIIAASVLRFKMRQARQRRLRLPLTDLAPFAIFFLFVGLWEAGRLEAAQFAGSNIFAQTFSLGLLAGGFALYLYARILLGDCWSVSVKTAPPHAIVKKGVYAHVRHPMYTAIMAMMAGSALLAANLILILILAPTFAAFWYKAREEEKTLSLIFKGYDYYMSKTKMFLPGIF